jgi:DNA polymerase-3 subunit delta'
MVLTPTQTLQREQERGRLADTYLFLGRNRQGLKGWVESCATVLLKPAGTLADHPDFILLDPEEIGVKGLKVEHVAQRKAEVISLERLLRYRPALGSRRICGLLDLQTMQADAQGALLKTLEEPPEGTIFLLAATNTTAILSAILSRCRIMRLPKEKQNLQIQHAASLGISEDDFARLLQGLRSAEAVFQLSTEERNQLLETRKKILAALQGDDQICWLPSLDGALADQRRTLEAHLSAAMGWLSSAPQDSDDHPAQTQAVLNHLQSCLEDISSQVSPKLCFQNALKCFA